MHVANIAVSRTLEDFGLSTQIKWPNIVMVNNKEIGIMNADSYQEREGANPKIFLGVHLNVNLPGYICDEIEQPTTSMILEGKRPFDRELVLYRLTNNVYDSFQLLLKDGFSRTLSPYFSKHLAFVGERVILTEGKEETPYEGTFEGLQEENGDAILRIDGVNKGFSVFSSLKMHQKYASPVPLEDKSRGRKEARRVRSSWPAGIKSTPIAAGKIDLATGMMSREDIITDKDGNIVERRRHAPTLWEAHDTRVSLPPSFSVPDSRPPSSVETPSASAGVLSLSSESSSIVERRRDPPTPSKTQSASASSKVGVSTPAIPPEPDDEGSGDEGKEGKGEGEEAAPEKPFGTYRDASYHHQSSTGLKSPAPKNGQETLNNSVTYGNRGHRVGVDPKNKEIVVFMRDGIEQNTYHGHIRTWDQLEPMMQKALRDAGKVRILGSGNKIKFI